MRRDEKRREEMRRDEVCSVKGGVSSVTFGTQSVAWRCIARCSCASPDLDNNSAADSPKAFRHGPGLRTAHVSSIDEKGLIV